MWCIQKGMTRADALIPEYIFISLEENKSRGVEEKMGLLRELF